MRALHTAVLVICPAVLLAQEMPHEAFHVFPPSISARVERCRDFDQAHLRWINDLAVDSAGFLWCASTLDAVARFDGYEAQLYRDDPADSLKRSRNAFTSIEIDREGFVWSGSSGGLMRLNTSTGKSRWYLDSPHDSRSVPFIIPTVLATSDGEVWVAGSQGIAKYNNEADSFTFFSYPQECLNTFALLKIAFRTFSLCQVGRDIWVGMQGAGLARFDRFDRTWKVYRYNPVDHSGPSSDYVIAVSGDRSGNLWVGSDAGLECYCPATNVWRRPETWRDATLHIPRVLVTGIDEDEYGDIWISTRGAGIFRIDRKNGHLLQFLHSATDPESLPFNELIGLRCLRRAARRESMAGGLHPSCTIVWVPVGYWGTWRIIVREEPFTRILFTYPEERFPRSPSATVLEPSGSMWLGLDKIVLLDPQERTWRSYTGPAGIGQVGRLSDGAILLSTGSSQLWMRDPKRDVFFAVAPQLKVTAFLEENDSTVWLGCEKDDGTYLSLLNRRTGKCAIYPRQDSTPPVHREFVVSQMCPGDSGSVWYGTAAGGLIRFDRFRKTYKRYASRTGLPDALIHNQIFALVPDSGGRLWVGTKEGLDLMDCKRGTFEHMDGPNPASKLCIMGMVDDGEGHLWIASLSAFACFTKSSRTFRWLPIPNEFKRPVPLAVSFDASSRKVSVGMPGGLFMFSIDYPLIAAEPSTVVLTSLKVFEKPYPLDGEISSLKSVTLPYSASFISFTFAALDFLNLGAHEYAYRLEPFETDWVLSGSRRYVSYSNLEPGKYVFRVKATSREGIWNEKAAVLDITIHPPWYRTYWAYGAYALLAGGLLFVIRRFDRKRTALKHDLRMKDFEATKMHEMDQLKSRFFANISHEFRTPLTLILGPLDQLLTKIKDEESHSNLSMMRRNALRLLQLINQLLDLSRLDAGKMSVQVRSIDLVGPSRALVMSFTSLAERKNIHLIFDPEAEQINAYADRDKFEKILTNLLSNAFKFTRDGGEIKVVLGVVDGSAGRWAVISVADTGIGIGSESIGKIFDRFYQVDSSLAQEHGGTGIGLALTKELVEIHKGRISVKSVPGHGSTFTVHLPIGREHWTEREIVTDETDQPPSHYPRPAGFDLEEETAKTKTSHEETGKPVVLIVEDNVDVRGYIRGFLHELYTIVEAGDGREALKKARETTVDLVISDVMMPEMDGVELCRTLKNDDRTSHIPVILLTARASMEGRLEGLDIGADDYIIKPFDAREVATRARNLIELRRGLRAKYGRQVALGLSKMDVATVDERFLKSLTEKIEQHISDAKYDTETVAYDMFMSRMQLNRKIHALTGYSTHGLIRELRMQRATELLERHAGNVAEVATAVGFNNLSHFARVFRERFGVPPSEYNPPPSTGARGH